MKSFNSIVRWQITAFTLVCSLAYADHPDPLPFSITTTSFDYDIYFDASNPYDCSNPNPPPGADLNFFPIAQAMNVADALDSDDNPVPGFPPGYLTGYMNLGFAAPDFSGEEDEVQIFDCAPGSVHDDIDCDNGRAIPTRIILPSTVYCNSSERNVRRVTGHELFHHIQFGYAQGNLGAWGKVAFEGTARMMEDEVYDDIDSDTKLKYFGQVGAYLRDPNRDFWTVDYDAALAWKYLSEQFGTPDTEPQYGADFIRRFWENVEANSESPDLPATIEQTIQGNDGDGPFADVTLRSWFQNFNIANIAKEFDVSGLAEAGKYRYVDENDGNGITYPRVTREWSGDTSGSPLTVVDRWGAAYLEATPESSCGPGLVVVYRVDTDPDTFLGLPYTDSDDARYAVLVVNESDEVIDLVRGAGKNFAAAFLQDDFSQPNRIGRLLVVQTGGDGMDVVQNRLGCGPVNLDVVLPDNTYKAYVGPPDNPRNMIVRLQISGPANLGGATVRGLRAEDFEVYVGAANNPADRGEVLAATVVLGEYWLVVKPPVKPGPNTYDLNIKLPSLVNSIYGSSASAVSYEQRILDQMLVIDRSGSMANPAESPKIDAAMNAARLFVDAAAPDERIGVASFSGNGIEPTTDATVDSALGALSHAHRQQAKQAISSLVADGATSIGDGLDVAASQFPLHGSAAGEDWMVLLSDGMENEALYWTNVEAAIKAAGIKVNTIALGTDADQVLLQEIAYETGGQYYYVDVGTLNGSGLVAAAATPSSLPNRLADAFASASETIQGHERLWDATDTLALNGDVFYPIDVSGDGIINARFLFNWDDSAEALGVEVLRPNGTPVADGVDGARIAVDDTHIVVEVGDMATGQWTVNLSAGTGTPTFLGILSGDDVQGPELDVYFGQPPDDFFYIFGAQFVRGLPQPIIAELLDSSGAVSGADIIASVEHPDGSVIELPLFDDGLHDDGAADDGVYANLYTRTTVGSRTDQPDVPGTGTRGSYNVAVEATGNDFQRIRKVSFQVLEHFDVVDSDFDGMPDLYENLHDCLDAQVDDGGDDADNEGLDNNSEWDEGTDPCHPDTDRGGESDASELARGANPFDPADDALPRPIDAEVVDWVSEHLDFPGPDDLIPGSNLIRYQVNPAYDQIRLMRSTSADGPFAQAAQFSAHANGGFYRDIGLVNDTTYYYQVIAISTGGGLSAPSHVFSGTPRAEPVPPIGSVRINMDDPVTANVHAMLALVASADTTEMLLANDSRFTGSTWQAFAPTANWTLAPDPETGIATVFVRYRDAAGNESPTTYHDAIEKVSSLSVGTIDGQAWLAPNIMVAGITLEALGEAGTPLAFTSQSGMFSLKNLPAGTYDLRLSYPGYDTAVVPDIVVPGGGLVRIGTIVLDPTDTDSDSIPDIDDNCIKVPNPTQCDGDGDGYGNHCDADFNNDGIVNNFDIGIFKAGLGTANPVTDLNCDGVTNNFDIGLFKAMLGNPPGPSGALDASTGDLVLPKS